MLRRCWLLSGPKWQSPVPLLVQSHCHSQISYDQSLPYPFTANNVFIGPSFPVCLLGLVGEWWGDYRISTRPWQFQIEFSDSRAAGQLPCCWKFWARFHGSRMQRQDIYPVAKFSHQGQDEVRSSQVLASGGGNTVVGKF